MTAETQTGATPVENSNSGRGTPDFEEVQKLNLFFRFLLYGLVGLAVEITFTALWQVCEQGNRKLHGITSIYAFAIYGMSSIAVERMYLRILHLEWYYRGLIYLAWTYAWEFSTGFFLRQFDACPWDYEPYFKGHIMGLITMEYAPLWYVGSMFQERFIIKYVLLLRWRMAKEKEE